MEKGHIDELALLMYCNVAGLEIDERVTGNLSANALIMFQNLCSYLSREEQEDVLMNYGNMMALNLLEFEEWYLALQMTE